MPCYKVKTFMSNSKFIKISLIYLFIFTASIVLLFIFTNIAEIIAIAKITKNSFLNIPTAINKANKTVVVNNF